MDSIQFNNNLENNNLNSLIKMLLKEIEENKLSTIPLFQIAKVFIKKDELVKAVNTYITILEIEPSNQEAKFNKESTLSIISQSQLDIIACTNTHMDPWV